MKYLIEDFSYIIPLFPIMAQIPVMIFIFSLPPYGSLRHNNKFDSIIHKYLPL